MESSDNHIDAENEVKKLQALVKKLEKQNELLRSKQKLGLDSEKSDVSLANGDVGKTAASVTPNSYHVHAHPTSNALKHQVGDVGLEDVDVLDIDNLSLKDDEDSWLYSSPKPLTPQQSNVNLYKWVRQDFDHPSPELQSARKILLSKLDEVARMNRSCSTPALGSPAPPAKAPALLSRSTEDSRKYHSHYSENPHRKHGSPSHQRHSMLAAPGSRLENGTYTRRRKPEEHNGNAAGEKEKSEEGSYHKREGTDVEKLARQQEESLRQSIATYTSPKRVLHNKSMSIASDTDNSVSPVGSNRSSPGRFDYEGSFFSRHRNSFGSDCSTPPDSPGVFQQHSSPYSDQSLGAGVVRSSSSRLQYPAPSTHSSDSSLDQHQLAADSAEDFDSDLHLPPDPRGAGAGGGGGGFPIPPASSSSRLLSASGLRSSSPATATGMGGGGCGGGGGGTRTPGPAYSQGSLVPQRSSGLPAPRRSIPRPSSSGRSSLPMPRRSGIPSHRSSAAQERDQSWRDGCF